MLLNELPHVGEDTAQHFGARVRNERLVDHSQDVAMRVDLTIQVGAIEGESGWNS